MLIAILTELRRNLVDEDETQIPADNETQINDNDETQVPESQGSNIPRSEESQQVVTGLIASIERRWHNFEEDDIYSVSTLLDPRFKELCFSSTALTSVKRTLRSLMRLVSIETPDGATCVISDDDDDSAQEETPVRKKKCLWDHFDEEVKRKKAEQQLTSEDANENELTLYLTAGIISRKEDPMVWWKDNRGQFPTLAKLAREYLAVPAMSTPSERIFSAAGYISGQRRCRLSGEHVNHLVFLNKNM